MIAALLLAAQLAPQEAPPEVEQPRCPDCATLVDVSGGRLEVRLGSILLPRKTLPSTPLVVHFHGEPGLAERKVQEAWPEAAVLAVHAGSGSRVYEQAVSDPSVFQEILDGPWQRLVLTAWSAGYGAIRHILRQPAWVERVDAVVLLDGMHAARESMDMDVGPFLNYARLALRGERLMLVTHSEVFPGTYASTTETADWLLEKLGLKRQAAPRPGPLGMRQLSDIRESRFRLIGFAGDSALDHAGHINSLGRWVREIRRSTAPDTEDEL